MKIRKISLLAALCCSISAGLLGCSERAKVREGDLLLQSENYEGAAKNFQESIEQNLAVEEAHEKLRQCYMAWADSLYNLKSYDEALKKVEYVIEHYPRTREAIDAKKKQLRFIFLLARNRYKKGTLVEPLEKFRWILKQDPNYYLKSDINRAFAEAGIVYFSADRGIFRVAGTGGTAEKLIDHAIDPWVTPGPGAKENRPVLEKKILFTRPAKRGSRRGSIYVYDPKTGKSSRVHKSTKAARPLWAENDLVLFSKERTLWATDQKGEIEGKGKSTSFVDAKNKPYFDTIFDSSPDSEWLICSHLNGKKGTIGYLFKLSADFNTGEILASIPNEQIRSIDWSPDGKRILFATDQGLYTIPSYGGTRNTMLSTEANGYEFASAAWSPNGQSLLFIGRKTGSEEYGIFLVNQEKEVTPLEIQGVKKISPSPVDWLRGRMPKAKKKTAAPG